MGEHQMASTKKGQVLKWKTCPFYSFKPLLLLNLRNNV